MAEKDITERILLAYNDVFADVVNGLLFKDSSLSPRKTLLIRLHELPARQMARYERLSETLLRDGSKTTSE